MNFFKIKFLILLSLTLDFSTIYAKDFLTPDKIRTLLLEETSRYTGLEGYLRFSDDHFDSDMHLALIHTLQALSLKQVNQLEWGKYYRGSTLDFKKDKTNLTDFFGKIRNEYKGRDGYKLYTDSFYSGQMQLAYENVSAVLSTQEFKELRWTSYVGTTTDFSSEYNRLFDSTGEPKKEYTYANGFTNYSNDFYSGKIRRAFANASAALSYENLIRLNWKKKQNDLAPRFRPKHKKTLKPKAKPKPNKKIIELKQIKNFDGKTKEFIERRKRILDSNDQPKAEYLNSQGYVKYAEDYYSGRMHIAFKNVFAVLFDDELTTLNWKKMYEGKTATYLRLRNQILDSGGQIKKEYIGAQGYAKFVDDFYSGFMYKRLRKLSDVLTDEEILGLNWGNQYMGMTSNFRTEADRLFNANGLPIQYYQGSKGYIKYADDFYSGKMDKAFINVSAVLTQKQFLDLNWGQQFDGTTVQLEIVRNQILDPYGHIKKEYQGPSGYIKYADDFHSGKMNRSFVIISAALSEFEFDELNWGKKYEGKTSEIFDESKNIRDSKTQYLGPEGYLKYADDFYSGKMDKTFKNVSATLSKQDFIELNWGKQYSGTTSDYRAELNRLLDFNNRPRPEFMNLEGFIKYADQFYLGDMKKALGNVSTVLSNEQMATLNWGKSYLGTTKDFRIERDRILDINDQPLKEYQQPEGYIKYADKFYSGKMDKTFMNISAALSKYEFTNLRWGKVFLGTTSDLHELRYFLFAEGLESAITKWFGHKTGLTSLVNDYLISKGYNHPLPSQAQAKIRQKFRAVVSDQELQLLGWGYVRKTNTCENYLNF